MCSDICFLFLFLYLSRSRGYRGATGLKYWVKHKKIGGQDIHSSMFRQDNTCLVVFQFAFVVRLIRQIIIIFITTVNNVRHCGVDKCAGYGTTFISEKRQ